jgi:small nuclear ribonucleoprotein B and B'
MTSRNSKIAQLIHYRIRVVLQDGRHLVGQLSAYDKHMNLVLVDCEELRPGKKTNAVVAGVTATAAGMLKRTLGLVILRGEHIVSFSVEAGPPPRGDAKHRVSAAAGMPLGPGVSRPIARGAPMLPASSVPLPPGAAAPMRGMQAPGFRPNP